MRASQCHSASNSASGVPSDLAISWRLRIAKRSRFSEFMVSGTAAGCGLSGSRIPVSPATLFARRDANKDGKVTLEEFLAGRDGDKRPPLERRFKALDRDGDGTWSASELPK
jgi:hypothetical protein